MRVATVNMKRSVGRARAERGLRRVAKQADVIGCQEWPARRAGILRRLEGFGYFPRSRPILWRAERFRFVSGRRVVLAAGRRVNPLPGRRRRLPDSDANVVVLERLEDGAHVTAINFHLPAASELAGRFRLTARGRMSREASERLAELFREHELHGPTFALGDANMDVRDALEGNRRRSVTGLMRRAGAVPCWAGNLPRRRRDGTHGRRIIDVIYAGERARSVLQLETASDHDAVIATYR